MEVSGDACFSSVLATDASDVEVPNCKHPKETGEMDHENAADRLSNVRPAFQLVLDDEQAHDQHDESAQEETPLSRPLRTTRQKSEDSKSGKASKKKSTKPGRESDGASAGDVIEKSFQKESLAAGPDVSSPTKTKKKKSRAANSTKTPTKASKSKSASPSKKSLKVRKGESSKGDAMPQLDEAPKTPIVADKGEDVHAEDNNELCDGRGTSVKADDDAEAKLEVDAHAKEDTETVVKMRLDIDDDAIEDTNVVATAQHSEDAHAKEDMIMAKVEAPRVYMSEVIEETIAALGNFEQDLIQAVADSFIASSTGAFQTAPVAPLGANSSDPSTNERECASDHIKQVCIKAGYGKDNDYYVVKVAGGHGQHSIPKKASNMQIYSSRTCQLMSVLLDEGTLTGHSAAAVGAVAAKYFAPPVIEKIGILGTSIQARRQLHYLKHVTDCRRVIICGRTAAKVEDLVLELRDDGWKVQATLDTPVLLDECDLIVTATSSREPLVFDTPCTRPQLITCIGADEPGKMELEPELVAGAELLLTDSLLQSKERGEFRQALSLGLVDPNNVFPIGSRLLSDDEHKHCSGRTIFDSSGVAAQDYAVVSLLSRMWNPEQQ